MRPLPEQDSLLLIVHATEAGALRWLQYQERAGAGCASWAAWLRKWPPATGEERCSCPRQAQPLT
jgi:hypothetical protein